ncbi:MAG: autoinducer binding domain-containing protein [Rhizobiales bacterium]|nr:autoinducer binding domain-containing protein [Hyphomicrobiales bacterium]
MSSTDDIYGQRTLDFVERLQRLTEYTEICRVISAELEWYGLNCVTVMSLPGPGRPDDDGFLMNTRPMDYIANYKEKHHLAIDPVVTELKRTAVPYSWQDVREKRPLNRPEKRIIDEGRDFGMRDGLIVPIVSLTGEQAVFSPCGENPDLSQRARSALELVGIYSHQVLKRALLKERRDQAVHTPLTAREREVLQWVAIGKSDDEIGDLLNISALTVKSHVEASKRKLDAFRRTYAVVQAIRFGEISL